MSLRLLLIETRRNVGLWFLPVILLFAWWLLSAWGWVAILWDSTNRQLQAVVVPLAAPAMVGVAAWMAGRERRRGMEDLLASQPSSPLWRGLTLWLATAAWGILAYAVFATYMMGRTALVATWGGPEPWRVGIVVAAILAGAVWGVFAGSLVPSRFTPPVVAVAALGLELFLSSYMVSTGGGYSPTWVTYLAPDKAQGGLLPWATLIYAGLTAAGLAALALRSGRTLTRWAALVASTGLALSGVVMVWGETVRYTPDAAETYNGWGQRIEFDELTQPEPVCQGSPVTVCVHPMYQPVLAEGIAAANRLAEPLLGLPGVPLSAKVMSFTGGGTSSMFEVGDRARLDVADFATQLVADRASLEGGWTVVNEPQQALRSWLLERAGIDSHLRCDDPSSQGSDPPPGHPTRAACNEAAQFAQLSPAEQRAWLEEHYAALRAGELSLEDLP